MNRSRKERRIRDQRLLDTLESARQSPYQGIVWRSVKQGRDPLTCWRSGGRWDDGTLDVLYTSEDRDTAIAERRYHLYQGQPIPPSNVSYELFELKVSLEAVVRFPDLEILASTGLDPAHYGRMSYLQRQAAYSTECCHLIHFKAATCSKPKLPPDPGKVATPSERSNAVWIL